MLRRTARLDKRERSEAPRCTPARARLRRCAAVSSCMRQGTPSRPSETCPVWERGQRGAEPHGVTADLEPSGPLAARLRRCDGDTEPGKYVSPQALPSRSQLVTCAVLSVASSSGESRVADIDHQRDPRDKDDQLDPRQLSHLRPPSSLLPLPIPTVRVAPLRSRADSRRLRRTSSTVPPAPSTELLRLMAPRVAVAQATVSRVAGRGSHRSVHFSVRRAAPRPESLGRYSSQRNTTDGDERSTGPWYTASTFVPSGSKT